MPNQALKIEKAIENAPLSEVNTENETEKVGTGDLIKSLSDIKSIDESLKEKKKEADINTEELRADIMRDLLTKLKDLGVDPSDSESINNFLKNLEMQDPDLKELFEVAFSGLLDEDTIETPQIGQGLPQSPPQGLPQSPQQGLPDIPKIPQQPQELPQELPQPKSPPALNQVI